MLELRILVDDIDYDSIAEYLIPAVAEKLRREEKGGILGGVLAGNPDVAASVARTVLGTMSQEQKDQLLVQLVTKNREKLLDKGNQAARSRGIGVQKLPPITSKKEQPPGGAEALRKRPIYRQNIRPAGRLFFFACNRRKFLI